MPHHELHKKRILIIDDDDCVRHAIKRILIMEGYENIEQLENPMEAKQMISDFQPHLVILDIKMPEKDGYEICLDIRTHPDSSKIKIIGMSGISGGIGDAILNSLGANAFFTKPFDHTCFLEKIQMLLTENAS